MKMIRDKLMMCAAFVGLISSAVEAADQAKTVRLKTGKEMSIPTTEQSSVVRDREYYAQTREHEKFSPEALRAKAARYVKEAASREAGRGQEVQQDFELTHAEAREDLRTRGPNDFYSQTLIMTIMRQQLIAFENVILHEIETAENNLDIESRKRDLAKNSAILNEIRFIKQVLVYADNKSKNQTLTEDDALSIHDLLYAFISLPGSVLNSTAQMGGVDPRPIDERFQEEHFSIMHQQRMKQLSAQDFCPDAHVLGRTVKELFPYFTRRAFENGMITNISTGDRHPLTTIKLNGRWWKVYAVDRQTQGEWESFTLIDYQDNVYDITGYNRRGYNGQGFNVYGRHQNGWENESWRHSSRANLDAEGYNRAGYRETAPNSWSFRNRQGYDERGNHAQNGYNRTWDVSNRGNQTIFYWPNSVRQVVAPYAFRFDQSAHMTNSLLAENDQAYYDQNQMRYIQPEQSVVAKKLHRAITSTDNGVFWQRDTAFDDGQSNFCTYKSSSYTGVPRRESHGNFERTDCTFIFEPAAEPNSSEFDARKNGFMKRVYADRQAYYMRNQNLGHYYIDPQDDPVAAQAKVMGEFKERIARDRIYQMQDPEQRRADGRIYSVTPSRVYQAARNVREALSIEDIDGLNSYEFNNRVYLYNRQARHGMGDSTEALADERFSAMSANVSQASNTAAQRRAENALRKEESSGATESKGDDR